MSENKDWISVEDRMPQHMNMCFVLVPVAQGLFPTCDSVIDGKWLLDKNVKYWMEIPEIPIIGGS